MSDLTAFAPQYVVGSGLVATTTVAATTTSTASAKFSGNVDNNAQVQIQISNQTSGWAYVNFGTFGAVPAAVVATSYPVAPGSVIVTVDGTVSGATVILATGSGSVGFTRGSGF